MSGLAGQRAALVVAIVLLTGCGVRVSLGDYGAFYDGDGGVSPPQQSFDAEALDAPDELADAEPADASDDAVDEAPLADAIVD